MAKNRVQFQKGMSLPEFLQQFGTEEQCRQAIFQRRWPQGFRCPQCGHSSHCQLACRRLIQCNRCHHQASITAGTVFANTKLPLTTWFLAIYLLTQNKNGISAMALMRQLGIGYNAAWLMKHKLMQAMRERDDSQPLFGPVQMDDAVWGGERHGGKRGRGAPAKTAFVAAVQCSPGGYPLRMRLTPVKGFRSASIRAWAQKHLRTDSVVTSDGLACFRAIADTCPHWSITTGGGADSMAITEFTWVNTMIGNVKNSLHGTYHAVKPKHLGRYLAEFSYRFNRRFQLDRLVSRLAWAACHTPPLPYRLATLAEVQG